jgi:transcriptional antiterminator RfaH
MQNERWYCAQTRKTRLAVSCLEQQSFTVYNPMLQSSRSRNGRWIEAPEPVFWGYLFVRVQADAACWRAINGTRGVRKLLGNGSAPVAIADREIEQLQWRESHGLLRHERHRQIRVGDVVEFKVGSLVGLNGVVKMTRRERIVVLLQILGGDTVATCPRDWLRLAANA